MNTIVLAGCTPEPLMNYLKALGVFRLVSEQVDAGARACWQSAEFALHTQLDREALTHFFKEQYRPTPIVAPWGARSGFFAGSSEKTAREALDRIIKSNDERMGALRHAVCEVRSLLREMGLNEKATDEAKTELMRLCRNRLANSMLHWLDTCYVLTEESRRFPPLLGTGGNEGSGSYVSGFAQQVVSCILDRKHDVAICTALFGETHSAVYGDQTPGHFSPNAAGGANSSQGFNGPVTTNAWDYLLGLEGSCLWASAVSRRQEVGGARSMAAFPFTVNVTGSGHGTLALRDSVKPKEAKRKLAEIWLPLWPRPLALTELEALLAEGRASVGGRPAATGADLVRAAAGLGVDRGITHFERVAFLMRNGQSFLGVSLGQLAVRFRDHAELLCEIDRWFARFRSRCQIREQGEAPARFTSALRHIESAIFDYCRSGGPRRFAEILQALGRAERELAMGESFRTDRAKGRTRVPPLAGLSTDWIAAANDGSIEFQLALALAGIYDPELKVGPIRINLEPVDWTQRSYAWVERDQRVDRRVVWTAADLASNLAAILRRRVMDAGRLGVDQLPVASRRPASLSSVAAFLSGECDGRPLDEERLEELLWGFMLIDHRRRYPALSFAKPDTPLLPRAYALLKLLFLPSPIDISRDANGRATRVRSVSNSSPALRITPDADVLPLLVAQRVGEACQLAARRLRASGLRPLPHRTASGCNRDETWGEAAGTVDGRRLAAALLFPVCDRALTRLLTVVTRPQQPYEPGAALGA